MNVSDETYKLLTKSEKNCYLSLEKLNSKILKMTLIELANECNVSTATINRTLLKMGYLNLKHFKHEITFKNNSFENNKEIGIFEQKLCNMIVEPPNNINQCVKYLENSEVIYVIGFGITTSIAFDFTIHLREFGLNAIYINDSDMIEIINCNNTNKKELIFYISYSAVDNHLEKLSLLQKYQKKQILLTAATINGIAENCDLVLNTHSAELDGFLKSRIPLSIITMQILLKLNE